MTAATMVRTRAELEHALRASPMQRCRVPGMPRSGRRQRPRNTGLSPSSRRNAARWVLIPACIRNSSPVPSASIHSAERLSLPPLASNPAPRLSQSRLRPLVRLFFNLVSVWLQSDVFGLFGNQQRRGQAAQPPTLSSQERSRHPASHACRSRLMRQEGT